MGEKKMNRHVSKEQMHMADTQMKKNVQAPLLSGKCKLQIKTILRLYLTPLRLAYIQNRTNNTCG